MIQNLFFGHKFSFFLTYKKNKWYDGKFIQLFYSCYVNRIFFVIESNFHHFNKIQFSFNSKLYQNTWNSMIFYSFIKMKKKKIFFLNWKIALIHSVDSIQYYYNIKFWEHHCNKSTFFCSFSMNTNETMKLFHMINDISSNFKLCSVCSIKACWSNGNLMPSNVIFTEILHIPMHKCISISYFLNIPKKHKNKKNPCNLYRTYPWLLFLCTVTSQFKNERECKQQHQRCENI